MPARWSRPERHEQHVAGQPLDGPRGELGGGRPGAEARLAEHRQAGAHLDHRAPRGGERLLHAREARRLAAPDQRGRREQQREQHHRGDRGEHQRVLAAAEDADGGEHHRAEDHQGEDVQQGLRDQGAEHHREAVAHPSDAPRQDQRTRGLAQPGRQRGRHQHADHGRPRGVAPAHAGAGQGGPQDRVPGLGADEHRGAHERERHQHPHGRGRDDGAADRLDADVVERERGEAEAADGGAEDRRAARHPDGRAGPRRAGAGLDRGQAPRRRRVRAAANPRRAFTPSRAGISIASP